MKLKEYDLVRSGKKLTKKVDSNTLGTVLIVYKSSPVEYEVEFVDSDLNSIEVLTVKEEDIILSEK